MFPPKPPAPPRPPAQPPQPIRPPEVVVQLDSNGWESAVRTTINSRKQLKIVIRGQRVAAVKSSYPDICKAPAPPASYVPIPYPNVEMSLRGAGLGALAVLIASAAGLGYAPPGMSYDRRGAGDQDDELAIYLR